MRKVSNCCGAYPVGNGDCDSSDLGFCPECKEHCDYVSEDAEFDTENIKADFTQLDIIEALLKTSTISAENNEYWSNRLNTLSFGEAENLIEFLQRKQCNRILGGFNYNMGYINWFLKQTL